MTRLVSALISAFGVLAALLLLAVAAGDHRAGASPLWVVAGAVLLLGALFALVRDVRALRRAPGGRGRD
ncbi:hypothetical protein GCM10010420_10590 [Streptomyces glaucosporus]|uniref:Secreted protein n=1 Tax=Streptomyces glaucosporus TaxID=284044 RepID=A0ABP5UVY1_9ACTN